jgi:hypothetical protein
MKTKIFISILFLYTKFMFVAQDSLNFSLIKELSISDKINWTVDNFGNLLLVNKDLITKFDAEGNKVFEQSFKRYGQIASIDARNPMKILFFSEEQQSVFYTDNTLTKQGNTIDLSYHDLSYVTQVSASKRADKIWTFDQDNSKVTLISSVKSQNQKIENISGILDFKKVNQFFEANDNLWIVDTTRGVFQFDIYGTLITNYNDFSVDFFAVDDKYLYFLKDDIIYFENILNPSLKNKVILPVKNVKKFKIMNKMIYLESENTFFIYSLDFF